MKTQKTLQNLLYATAIVAVSLITGCSKDDVAEVIQETPTTPTPTTPLSSSKAITAFSFTSPAAAGTINEAAHTIDITVPAGTNVTTLIATFTSTGASAKVGTLAQVSGTTPNNFTTSVTYTVTAQDGSTQNYVVAVTVASPYVTIPDTNFRNYLKGKIPSAFGGVGGNQLNTTASAVLNLKDMDLYYLNIVDLKGIEYFTGLTTFSCYYNKVVTLDLSKNTALTSINCGLNELTTLILGNNVVLTDLECNGNNLTTFDLSKNTALTDLDCSLNKLTSLDVSKNTALKDLHIGNNKLTILDVSKNTVLRSLEIDAAIKCSHPSIKAFKSNIYNVLSDADGNNLSTSTCP